MNSEDLDRHVCRQQFQIPDSAIRRLAMDIPLKDVIQIDEDLAYKLHFAKFNGVIEPLDDWTQDANNWIGWQQYRGKRNDFNREYIFTLMNFYPEGDVWLFGGIFRVCERHNDRYVVELENTASSLIGRLKIYYPYKDRQTRVNFENHYFKMVVREITREPYGGRLFEGFDNINLSFGELETIVLKDRLDWKQVLQYAKGIYLITDKLTGKRYVGSAYGDRGIWSRWVNYVRSGHGGNLQLQLLVPHADLTYCREHFRFSLLEYHLPRALDDYIISRENFWKEILLTRGVFGLNSN